MVFSNSVRALNFAKLALKTSVHYLLCFDFRNFSYITIMPVIDERKKERETIAVFEAHPASVTDFEGAVNLPRQCISIPVNILRW